MTASCVDQPQVTMRCGLAGTSFNALYGGSGAAVIEGNRALWQLDQVKVYDGGADGDADTTGDNTLFAVQGVLIP